MNELEQVVKLLSTLGAETKTAFIWWLIIRYVVSPIIYFVGFSFMGYWISRAIIWANKDIP